MMLENGEEIVGKERAMWPANDIFKYLLLFREFAKSESSHLHRSFEQFQTTTYATKQLYQTPTILLHYQPSIACLKPPQDESVLIVTPNTPLHRVSHQRYSILPNREFRGTSPYSRASTCSFLLNLPISTPLLPPSTPEFPKFPQSTPLLVLKFFL